MRLEEPSAQTDASTGARPPRQTKEQIRYRLNTILENPTLERLFTSPTTRLDLFDELNRGSIILVDTQIGAKLETPIDLTY